MLWLLAYLCVGGANVYAAHVQGILSDGLEAVMYLLLWPLQLGFWMLVGIHRASTAVLERIFR